MSVNRGRICELVNLQAESMILRRYFCKERDKGGLSCRSRSCTVVLDSGRLDHRMAHRERLAKAVLVVASRRRWSGGRGAFPGVLKGGHTRRDLDTRCLPFHGWTVPRWPSTGFEQRPSFVAVADLQPCLLYLQPSEPTTNPNLMSRFILSFLRRAISRHLAWRRRVFLFLPGDRCASVYLVYLSSLSRAREEDSSPNGSRNIVTSV